MQHKLHSTSPRHHFAGPQGLQGLQGADARSSSDMSMSRMLLERWMTICCIRHS